MIGRSAVKFRFGSTYCWWVCGSVGLYSSVFAPLLVEALRIYFDGAQIDVRLHR